MKIVIVSDSHGQTDELLKVVEEYQEADAFIHCGDSELPADSKSIQPFVTVNGNCDWTSPFEDEKVLKKGSYKIYITHGHLYQVKTSLLSLNYKAEEKGANIVCFGHSHLVGAEMIENRLFLNPGSLRMPRGRKERTFMVLDLEENKAVVTIMNFDQMDQPVAQYEFEFGEK
ncbi:metallophosphoesterase [Bacillus carboniphilus]|uniref:Phosphoesterase n=1 Tax=Bacillus carboniphilus TaxID=86663 RepID=A0ABN0WDG8_9BACI